MFPWQHLQILITLKSHLLGSFSWSFVTSKKKKKKKKKRTYSISKCWRIAIVTKKYFMNDYFSSEFDQRALCRFILSFEKLVWFIWFQIKLHDLSNIKAILAEDQLGYYFTDNWVNLKFIDFPRVLVRKGT